MISVKDLHTMEGNENLAAMEIIKTPNEKFRKLASKIHSLQNYQALSSFEAD